jgi:hypothetical protein
VDPADADRHPANDIPRLSAHWGIHCGEWRSLNSLDSGLRDPKFCKKIAQDQNLKPPTL